MSKAEQFIEARTMNGTNQIINGNYGTIIPHFTPWLTPDEALRAVEIAREEVRKEILKDAVVCDVFKKGDSLADLRWKDEGGFNRLVSKFNNGDRVKLIIIKEE